jgi:meso-butanediol dehydrogenase/(S,S)-butanediol dehydrogenase/diacetyl reductase
MNERFNGKVTIVTGAASGIGRAVAERFFKEGASVFAVDRNPETLAKLPPTAERWHPHFCDVAAKGASAPLIQACVARFGGLDVLANIAGVGNSKSAHDTSDEDFEFWINANLSSTFRLCRDALPELRKRRGNILNMASGLAIVGMAKQAAYTAAKAGIAGSPAKWPLNTVPKGSA